MSNRKPRTFIRHWLTKLNQFTRFKIILHSASLFFGGGGICKRIKLWNAQGLPVINSPPPPPGIATVRLTKNLSSRHISAQVSKQLDETASINFQHSQIRSCYRPVAHVSTTTNMGKTTLSITEVETIKTHIQHSLIFVNVLTQHFCILLTS